MAESEVRKSKAGDNYLVFVWHVLDGPHKGHKVWDQLHLWNRRSEPAREIARGRMADVCRACARPRIKHTEELHGIPCLLKVDIEPGRDGYDDQNRIKGVYPDGADTRAGAGVTRPTPAAQGEPNGEKPPWERNWQEESTDDVDDGIPY